MRTVDPEARKLSQRTQTLIRLRGRGSWSSFNQFEGRVGHGNEEVGEKRQFRDACDAGGEETGQGLLGEGGGKGVEKFENK